MTRQTLDEYLDGALDSATRANVEQALANDAAAAALLVRIRTQRSLRSAAFASYMPSQTESAALTERVMAAAHAPVGRIGPRVIRWTAGIAAAIAIGATMFAVGRVTAPVKVQEVAVVQEKTVYQVVYVDAKGDKQIQTCDSEQDRDDFVRKVTDEEGGTVMGVVAELNPAGHM